MVKIKYVYNPSEIQSQLKKSNKIHVIDKILHENKNEKLRDYACEFEMVGKLTVGDQVRETHTRFGNITEYEAYVNSIGKEYDAEDAIFNGYVWKINTPQFNLVNRILKWV